MGYTIVTKASQDWLIERVNEMMERGWRPQGGASFAYYGSYKETWLQAMVLEK